VGGSLARRLIEESDVIAAKSGLALELKRVSVRDLNKPRQFEAPAGLLTDQPEEVVNDPSVVLVVELMGGLEPAGDLVLAALRAGKPVVTANKELIAARGQELFEAAEQAGVSLLFEAAVGGGIPIIRPLSQSLSGEKISRVLGIVNGTTNFILTQMTDEGLDYREALAEAQTLGYAEADPTADVSGGDAASKAAILASLSFGTWVHGAGVFREGIESIGATDIRLAADLGYAIKLLAVAELVDDGVSVRVHPTMVEHDHPLASVRGAHNAIYLEGPAIGELLFSGPGAGGEPTATAVLGDLIDAAREHLAGAPVSPKVRFGETPHAEFEGVSTRWYVRLEVADAPGVLARIAGTFGEHGVSIGSVWQEGRGDSATLLLVTHHALERDLRAAVDEVSGLDVVRQVAATIRVHGDEG
jgi:homoserine dehydrogenase